MIKNKKMPSFLVFRQIQTVTLPAEVIYHRKVKLNDADIQTITKDMLTKFCDEEKDIFSKSTIDIGKMVLVQMLLIPKDSIKIPRPKTIHITP